MKNEYKKHKAIKTILEEPSDQYISHDYYNMAYYTISKNYIKKVLKRANLTVPELINILPISIDTYKRKVEFNPSVTEKILEIEEVYTKGLAAFGESFYKWMDTINPGLGNIHPKQLLNNSFGIRILLDEIGRMEHGIFA